MPNKQNIKNKSLFIKTDTIIIVLVYFFTFFDAKGQFFVNSDTLNSKRVWGVTLAQAGIYSISYLGLNQLWYANYERSRFHFFDDSKEWLQVDKAGHCFSAYYISTLAARTYRWTGMSHKKAVWIGGGIGWLYISTIEILDGFSAKWGASVSDLAANSIGSLLFILQEAGLQEQPIVLKYSYRHTRYPQYRPDVLGKGIEKFTKDYNGTSYWISANIFSLTKIKLFPKWLNLAFGYGASGMLGGESNPATHNGVPLPYYERNRQFYLSFDVDLSRIKTNSEILHYFLRALNCIKIPLPAIEYSDKQLHYHWLGF